VFLPTRSFAPVECIAEAVKDEVSMGTLHNLTLRTATAVGRLADLQRRAEKVAENRSTVAKTALAELSTALEELQVANEALQEQLAELRALRTSTKDAVDRADEFAHVLPVAAVWTDRAGVIESGNDAAAQLLNVGHHHLVGKSLMLFITDRGALFTALRSLCEPNYMSAVDVDVTVRPRERRPRKMKLAGRRLQHDNRCLWFFHTPEAAKQEEVHAVGAEV
jgi:PAS domain-containing protein